MDEVRDKKPSPSFYASHRSYDVVTNISQFGRPMACMGLSDDKPSGWRRVYELEGMEKTPPPAASCPFD